MHSVHFAALAAFSTGLLAPGAWCQSPCPDWTASIPQTNVNYGRRVASAGDVNGDGYDDVLVSAYTLNVDIDGDGVREQHVGRVYVYLGSPAGPISPPWTASGNEWRGYFGLSLASAGDVNGDGFDDVIIGQPGESDDGRVALYLGSATGLASAPSWDLAGSQLGASALGLSVSMAGDTDADGYDDVILSASFDTALIFLGNASGVLSSSPVWTMPWLGHTIDVAAAGDVNGDGYDDVLIGVPFYTNPELQEGAAFVAHGPFGLASTWPWDWSVEGNLDHVRAGVVAGAGDVDGDGYDDVVVGAPRYPIDSREEGQVFVYRGSATGLATSPSWMPNRGTPDTYFGADFGLTVALGDLDGDGLSDVIVAQPHHTAFGRVLVYPGSSTGMAPEPARIVTARQNTNAFDGFGDSAAAGDVNGDGYADLLVGQWTLERVYGFFGSATGTAPVASATYAGDGVNADVILPIDIVIGRWWRAPIVTTHPHGSGGSLVLQIRTSTFNGPTTVSPVGGRPIEFLISGPKLATFSSSFNVGTNPFGFGDTWQLIPNDASLVGVPWSAQYTVAGGGFVDLSQAVFGIVGACN